MINKLKTSYLLLLPFFVLPFLITSKFQDPTLLIKRSSTFFLFFIIGSIFFYFKIKSNSLSRDTLKIIYGKFFILILLLLVSYFNSINFMESFWGILYLFGWTSIYIIFSLYGTNHILKYIIYTTTISGTIVSIIALSTYFNVITIDLPGYQVMRSTFGNRNFLGQYFCFIVPASISTLFIKNNRYKHISLISFIIIITTCIILRQRAAWLGVTVSLILFFIINKKLIWRNLISIKKNKMIIFIFIISFLSFYLLNNYQQTEKKPLKNYETSIPKNKSTIWKTLNTITNLNTESDWGGRLNMYKSSILMFKDHPFWGVGINNWRIIYPKYANNKTHNQWIGDGYFERIRQRPHNDFLLLLSELGIIPMLFIIYYLMYHLKLVIRRIKNSHYSDSERFINTFCLISIIAIMIESMFDFPLERTIPNLYFWSIFGYISTSNYQSEKNHTTYLQPFIFIFLFIASVFSIYDIKSNFYSKKANYYNYNNMTDESLLNSHLALNYYRNLDSAGTPIYYYIGIAEYSKGNKEKAMQNFSKSLDLSPYHVGALMNYLILLGETNNLEEAYAIMTKMKSIYPALAKPRLDMAKFYIKAGQNKNAKRILLDLKKENLADEATRIRDNLLKLFDRLIE